MTDEFHTTHWSVVVAAARDDGNNASHALQILCQNYWYPLYAYVRRRTNDEHRAQDLTQSFFAHLLEKRTLDAADPERGRFRAFLLTACKRFLVNERDKQTAQKRGGKLRVLSLDFSAAESRYHLEPATDLTPERDFDRQWAIALIDSVLAQLRTQFAEAGDELKFELMKPFLQGSSFQTHAELADSLQVSEGAAKVSVHRLRCRFRELLRQEIAQTVDSENTIDDEVQSLFELMS